ncbi:MAG: hypothetical protein H7067_19880 [Burkholderiales bacterium]|nr:hypothetical protein [Opitutaceae bacterium]
MLLVTALSLSTGSVAQANEAATKPAPAAASAPRLFGGKVVDAVHTTVTVEKINHETREVTVKGEQGGLRTVIAGPEVKRLKEIHVGDTIEVVYAESVIVLAGDSAGAPAGGAVADVIRAEKTEKPGGAAVVSVGVLATITALDATARTVTLQGPERTVTVSVGADAQPFDKIKVGDSVYLEITQAIAVAVTKSAPAAAK